MASSTTGEYVVSPNAPHTHTVILLHGRDSEAEEFASEFFESQGTDDRTLAQMFPTIKWVFPRSKTRQSARFETALCQWFDIWPIEEPQQQKDIQTAGLKESVSSILEAVLREASLVAPEKILLGGISQGSATAIHALLGCDAPLAGFIGLCTWLPFQAEVADSTHDRASIGTPIFLAHSKDDEVVPFGHGVAMRGALERIGIRVTGKEYEDGGHWVNEPQGVDDIAGFIQESFPDLVQPL